jgi:hypothetical protein
LSFIDKDSILARIRRKYWFIDSFLDFLSKKHAILLGKTGPLFLRRHFSLRGKNLFTHKHIIGKTGYGKSNLIGGMAYQLIMQDIPVALIDPHSDLATSLLGRLVDNGYFERPGVAPDPTKNLLYIDFGIKDEQNTPTHFLPFNILNQVYSTGDIAIDVVEVFLRMWPYLEQSSPHFQDVAKNGLVTLIENEKTLLDLPKVLSKKIVREGYLEQVMDPAVQNFFHDRFDLWDPKFAPQMLESTLNKISNLLFSEVIRYSLGQKENTLNFEEIMTNKKSVIFNLGGLRKETKRFLGCLLTLGLENAMYARDSKPISQRHEYFFIIDEFQMFVNTAEEAFNTFLSESRKFHVREILAHQYNDQLPIGLASGLQNTQRIILRLEDDAKIAAGRIGRYEPTSTKREVEDPDIRKKSLPRDYTVEEEQEMWATEIKELFVGEAFVKLEDRTEKIKIDRFPDTLNLEKLKAIEEYYARTLMTPRSEAIARVHKENYDVETPSPASLDQKTETIFVGQKNGTALKRKAVEREETD